MNEKERVRSAAACEAAYVLNDAVGALLVPKHLAQVATRFFDAGRMTSRYAGSLQRLAMQSAIINVYRVKEVRDHLLVPWLFSDEELRALGLPPIEEFVGDWSAFIAVRGQYAGHVLSRRSSRSRPGRIVAPEALGRALLRAGLWDAESFLRRVERHLISGIERVRDELFTRYPECREFVRRTYLDRLKSVIPEEEQ